MKVAFLDRDGTINKDYPDLEWKHVQTPEFLDGVIDAMKHIISHGYKIIIVTNQYIIGEGIISLKSYNHFTNTLLEKLSSYGIEILDIFFCPHKRSDHCRCCKPAPGMIEDACKKYPDIDLEQSFLVGDSIADQKLAENCGLLFYGIQLDGSNRIECLSDLISLIK